ncbi:hypothetical protein BDW74DRAFT_151755 [Aspergillus multicolor]|uniref:uncharacterized protein n=1 Tax=Aspergillus multicolor TaxID=41759 RepID=UPI003CCE2F63
MSALYRAAQAVPVWLGPGSAESDLIFNMCFLAESGRVILKSARFAETKHGGHILMEGAPTPVTARQCFGGLKDTTTTTPGIRRRRSSSDDPWEIIESIDFSIVEGWALYRMWQRTYWTRLWIIQELLLAKEVILFCGSKSIKWSTFERLPTRSSGEEVLKVDVYLGGDLPDGRHFKRILKVLAERKQASKDNPHDLLALLCMFRDSQCSNVRDRAYGLLGCSATCGNDRRGIKLVADYSITPAVLFMRLLSNMPRRLNIFYRLRYIRDPIITGLGAGYYHILGPS